MARRSAWQSFAATCRSRKKPSPPIAVTRLAGSPRAWYRRRRCLTSTASNIAAKTRRIEKEGRLVALSKATSIQQLANITEVASNGTLTALRTQEMDLTRKIAEYATQFGPNHPKVQQAQSGARLRAQPVLAQTQSITLAIRAELDAAKSEEEELKRSERASVLSARRASMKPS